MSHLLSFGDNLTFECSNGGLIKLIGYDGETQLEDRGGADGFAYFDDLHLNAYNDMVLNVDGDYNVKATVQHLTGDAILDFELHSIEAGGTVDVKVTGLKPNSWYRLQFNGILAACDGGRAHGKTGDSGMIQFNGVEIPNA